MANLTEVFAAAQGLAGGLSDEDIERRVGFGQLLDHYKVKGVSHSRNGNVIEAPCFLKCGVSQKTAEAVLEIQPDNALAWECRLAQCRKNGTIVSLCDYLEDGNPQDGKPDEKRRQFIVDTLHRLGRASFIWNYCWENAPRECRAIFLSAAIQALQEESDAKLVEDVISEAQLYFLKTLEAKPDLGYRSERETPFSNYLFGCAFRWSRNAFRKLRPAVKTVSLSAIGVSDEVFARINDETPEDRELLVRLDMALQQLPEPLRSIGHRIRAGATVREIAEEIHRSPKAAWKLINLVKQELRKLFGPGDLQ